MTTVHTTDTPHRLTCVTVRGPAFPGRAARVRPRPAAKPQTAQVPVYDQEGRRLNGMRPAGPGRVMDTRTGRYHDTVPSGDGVRIVR